MDIPVQSCAPPVPPRFFRPPFGAERFTMSTGKPCCWVQEPPGEGWGKRSRLNGKQMKNEDGAHWKTMENSQMA